MRQRALTANVGTIADIAGTMSVHWPVAAAEST